METFSSRLNSAFSEVSQAMKITGAPYRESETIDNYLDERLPPLQHTPEVETETVRVAPRKNLTNSELYVDYLSLSVGQDPAIPIPAYFDLHLESDLRLIQVKPLLHLPVMLGKLIADNLENHPLKVQRFSTYEHYLGGASRFDARTETNIPIIDETTIPRVMRYWESTAASVASCIYTHSDTWRGVACLEWCQEDTGKPLAFTTVHPELAEGDLSPEPLSLSSSLASKLQGISDAGLSNIVVFNFKRIGRPFAAELFRAVQAVANGDIQFAWTACTIPGCSPKCRMDGSEEATASGHTTGPDGDGVAHILNQLLQERHSHVSHVDYTTKSANVLPDMINKAFFLLQELWSLAVRDDTTFVVLSSGEEEVIGIRHRDAQTLYLSETLNVSREMNTVSTVTGEVLPTHLRVRCAMSMWALHDAIERAIKITDLAEIPERYYRAYDSDGQSY